MLKSLMKPLFPIGSVHKLYEGRTYLFWECRPIECQICTPNDTQDVEPNEHVAVNYQQMVHVASQNQTARTDHLIVNQQFEHLAEHLAEP